MSLLALLAASAATGGGGTPPSTLPPLPAPLDATIASMRPEGRVLARYVVDPAGGGDYTTIQAACDAGKALQTSTRVAEGAAALTPNYRIEVVVRPGTYTGPVTLWAFQSVFCDGAVVLTYTHPAGAANLLAPGVLTTEGSCYWEGGEIQRIITAGDEAKWPKYPVHHTSERTSVLADMDLTTLYADGAPCYTTPIGTDGHNGATTILYGGVHRYGIYNNHGQIDGATGAAETWGYINVTSHNGFAWGAITPNADEIWVVGGSAGGGAVAVTGTGARLHLSGTTGVGSVSVQSGIQDARSDWPIPTGCLSAADRAYYGM